MPQPIYLDYNATTPVDALVLEQMLPWFSQHFGNASSSHKLGKAAANAVADSRDHVADLLQVKPAEILFTSGATRAIQLAIEAVWAERAQYGTHFITVATEHKAMLAAHKKLEAAGAAVTVLGVEPSGLIDLTELENAITPNTALISAMWANNETGFIQPIEAIGKLARKHNTLFLCDATQAIGKVEVQPKTVNIDLMPFSAHKFYGPKGIGGLFVNSESNPVLWQNRKSVETAQGTTNVPGIVGLGKAAFIAGERLANDKIQFSELRHKLESALKAEFGALVNGGEQQRLPNTSNLSFLHIESAALLEALQNELAASTGSACNAANTSPSHVLTAMGFSPERIAGAVRFSIGRATTTAEIDEALHAIRKVMNVLAK